MSKEKIIIVRFTMKSGAKIDAAFEGQFSFKKLWDNNGNRITSVDPYESISYRDIPVLSFMDWDNIVAMQTLEVIEPEVL